MTETYGKMVNSQLKFILHLVIEFQILWRPYL